MKRTLLLTLTLTLTPALVRSQAVESFDVITTWTAAPASGVELRLSSDEGHSGKALRVDFDFHGGGGWAAFRKEVPLDLPENYEISFWIKGNAPRNTLELKLVDPTGENVWWINRPDFEFAGDWRKITFRKRHVTFAWGPAGGGEIRKLGAIEFAITAGTGGKGTVWIDDLAITPREVVRPYDATPVITRAAATHTIDFTRSREYGGIIVDWRNGQVGRDYDVQVSTDAKSWQTLRSVRGSLRKRDYIQLPEAESRYLRLVFQSTARDADLAEVRIMPLEWGNSLNTLFETIAADQPKGRYPKYFTGVQSYWTVIGENGDRREAMMNEEGAVEIDKASFSIEPFLFTNDKLITWHDVERTQSLYEGVLPVPTVTWKGPSSALEVTSWMDAGTLWLKYRVGLPPQSSPARLFLAIRPFQVNPTSQFLNTRGGVAVIESVTRDDDGTIRINGTQRIAPHSTPLSFGATRTEWFDVVDYMERGELPTARAVTDSVVTASAGLAFQLETASGRYQDIYIAVPRPGATPTSDPAASLSTTVEKWRGELKGFSATLPDQRLQASIRSNLGYVLINRDSAAIQPGSRSYERSWIRDGSLTSAALLRLGHHKEVREFIEWYAPYQYADGKVPCCVDHTGAGPVPENDSHGQLIYLITEYFRFTKDTAFVRRMYPHIERAVAYMDSLRNSRRTEAYRNTALFGLLPQSISHEGYSAKPMHSYWDDFFGLKGFKDAAWLAQVLGDTKHAASWAAMRDEFQADLIRSLNAAMQQHKIDYLPGAAELGDFDATSTTVGINPAAAQRDLPAVALKRTFDKYWESFVARRDSANWDAYTPYEWRVVGTFVRLGEKRRAHALLDWFMQHQRPAGWNHWAEVVFRDRNAPRFIGDMPHTWVGSDFIRSVLDMFAYDDDDDAVVLAAGVVPEWVGSEIGVAISGLHTAHGEIAYQMVQRGKELRVTFENRAVAPPGGFILRNPLDTPIRSANADGSRLPASPQEVRFARLPRELVLSY